MKLMLLDTHEGSHPASNRYVVAYNPDYHLPDGSYDGGDLVLTTDPAEAYDAPARDILHLYASGPTCECHRCREDGRPNRPLTAFNAVME